MWQAGQELTLADVYGLPVGACFRIIHPWHAATPVYITRRMPDSGAVHIHIDRNSGGWLFSSNQRFCLADAVIRLVFLPDTCLEVNNDPS